MNKIRKEVLTLITVNEKIQSAALRGDHFTDDELQLIYQCATELLAKVPTLSKTDAKAEVGGDGRI